MNDSKSSSSKNNTIVYVIKSEEQFVETFELFEENIIERFEEQFVKLFVEHFVEAQFVEQFV